MSDEFLTPRQLADWLGVPLRTVEKWRYEGTGPRAHRIGKHIRFRRRDVECWLSTLAD